jgi:hypothetical protein
MGFFLPMNEAMVKSTWSVAKEMKMKFKWIFFLVVFSALTGLGVMFFFYPRGLSLIFSYKKECRVARVEPFMKGLVLSNLGQTNKYSVICDDGSVCRAADTGFASVKEGDLIEFRGFPEFATFEEMGKCDQAQLIRVMEQAKSSAPEAEILPQSQEK